MLGLMGNFAIVEIKISECEQRRNDKRRFEGSLERGGSLFYSSYYNSRVNDSENQEDTPSRC